MLNDRSHSAYVTGNVCKIRSNLCTVGKNSRHDTRTFENEFEGAESHIARTYTQENRMICPYFDHQHGMRCLINFAAFFFKMKDLVSRNLNEIIVIDIGKGGVPEPLEPSPGYASVFASKLQILWGIKPDQCCGFL